MDVAHPDAAESVVVDSSIVNQSFANLTSAMEDLALRRRISPPLNTGVAAFSCADLFKSKRNPENSKALRWDTQISRESAAREASSLKSAMKYLGADIISLCGGLPSSDYFPIEELSVRLPQLPRASKDATICSTTLSTGKHDIGNGTSDFDLSVALNYGMSAGPPQLMRWITEHTEIVHNPKYTDWEICITAGSTAALDIALRLFCNHGDYLLTEEYSFSTAVETARPLGLRPLGIEMDNQGLLPSSLDNTLTNWDPAKRLGPKPFLLYTVPTGHNPTSCTQDAQRRREIYRIAEKHDLFIIEDEPYYFLQMDPFVSGLTHSVSSSSTSLLSVADFLSKLIPSYLSIDTSGRVLRLDSFSKIIAPGCRCGWVTGPAQIIERFIRNNEVTIQTPSGFSEIVLYKLLEENWGHVGFFEWLMFLRSEYTRRRDIIVNACEKYLPTEVVSWTPPTAGMFHWIKIDITKHPQYHQGVSQKDFVVIEERIFLAGVQQGVLLARGSWFRAEIGSGRSLALRMTFAGGCPETIIKGVQRIGTALREEFGLELLQTHGNDVPEP